MQDSFWVGGENAFYDGLKAKFEPWIRDLERLLEETGDLQKRTLLRSQIEELKAEYKEKLDSVDAHTLF